MKSEFYVYLYLREHTSKTGEAGTPYYAGKGKGKRAYGNHKKHGIPLPKNRDNIVILWENLTEEFALEMEMLLIATYGRVDNGTGILRNKTDGGDGTSGWIPPDWYRKNASDFRAGKTYEELMGDAAAKELRQKKSEAWMGNTPISKGKKMEDYLGEERARELKQRLSASAIGPKNGFFGKRHTEEQRERKRQEKLTAELIECEHCHDTVDHMNYGRWHGDNCKVVSNRKPREKKPCPHCGKLFSINGIGQHINKCKGQK